MSVAVLVTRSANEPHLQPPASTRGACPRHAPIVHAAQIPQQSQSGRLARSPTRARTHGPITSRPNHRSSTMSFKGSNGVAAERRVDLASLFCMIGRHGPAVALAVFAMVSVLAGFVIYRTVRGRRRGRKKTTQGEGESTPVETDEAVTQAGREPQACATSTDDGDVAKEEDDPTGTHLQVRRRAAAVVKSLSPSDVQAPLKQHAPSSHTQRVESVPTSFTEARLYLEEPSQSSVAEIQAEPATVCHLYATEDSLKDEEISEVSLKEPEAGQAHIDHEEVYAECQEGEDVSTNDTTQAEENDQPSAEQDNEIVAETGTVELSEDEVIHHQDGADPNENHHLAEEEEKHDDNIEELEKEFDGNIILTDEATVAFDAQSPQVEHPEIQAEPKEEHNLTSNQEMDLITDGGLGESSDIVSNSSSVPPMLDDDTSDPTTQIDSDMSTNDQEAEKVDVPTLEDETENLSGTTAEEPVEPLLEPWSSPEAQQSFPELDDIEVIPDGNNEDQNGDDTEKSTKPKFESVGDISGKDELSHEDIESSSQDQQNDQNLDEDSFVFAAPPPIRTKDPTNPPELRVCLPLFEPSELRDDNVSGGGEESGISSMAVSPELPDPSSNFDIIEMPATDHESPTEVSLEPQACLLLDDTTPSILEEEAEVYEPHPPPLPEQLDPSSNFDTVEMPATDHESPTEASLEPQACLLLDDTTPSILEEEAEVYEPHQSPLPEQLDPSSNFDTVEMPATDHESPTEASLEPQSCPLLDDTTPSILEEEAEVYEPHPSPLPEQLDPSSNFDTVEMPATDHESPTEASLEPQACLLLDDTTPSVSEEEAEVYEPHPPPLPEQLDPSSNFDTVEMPATDHESPTEASLEPQACHLLDDTTPSVLEEEAEVYEPHPPPPPEQICSWNVESLAKNKDTFGNVNDNQRETVSVQNDEWERQVDVKVVEVSRANEKLESAENKEPQMENDVKTEINIMEATMDHNEWITDGNPTFPWMNLSTPTFGDENHKASQQLPTQETNYPDSEPQSVPPVKQTDNSEENRKSQKANITFRVHYITRSPFQMLAVTGNRQELGNWKSFVPLEDTKDGYWSAVVSLPAQNHVQWKFAVVEKGEVRRWEECRNRLLDTGCGEDLLVHKLWGYL
ncbi:titin isoform X2 [Syngnathus acus]|uniref:titin isoform X2 n=1 Tax=Syngnathus acus TaxID=161584 RepID=UPI0018863441|nr:titin isoform X2 [Syngnathus acus]